MFTAGRKDLLDACLLAARSVKTSRTTVPILAALRVEAGSVGGAAYAEVTGTNLETTIAARVAGGVVGPDPAKDGTDEYFCVGCDQLVRFLREADDDEVSCETKGDALRVVSGRCRMDMPTFDAATFPETPPSGAAAATWEFPREALTAALDRAYVATGDDERTDRDYGHMALQGVLFAGETFVGCDFHRLCVQTVAAAKRGGSAPIKVHHRDVQSMSAILKAATDPTATLVIDPNQVTLAVGRARITCRGLAGGFPPWEKAIPKDLPWAVAFTVGALRRGVTQGGMAADADSLPVTLDFSGGRLRVSSESAAKGKADSTVDGDVPAGMSLKILFDPKTLVEMLRTLPDADTVGMRLGGDRHKLAMTVPGGTYYVTPMVKRAAAEAPPKKAAAH